MKALIAAAAARYRVAGRFAEGFAKGKMGGDPVYSQVLDLVGEEGRALGTLLDVGCGEAYLLALVAEGIGGWRLHGIDHDAGRLALGARAVPEATLEAADALTAELPEAQVLTCLDVLHYLPAEAQDALIARLALALAPDGILLLRDGEAGAGWRSTLTEWSERLTTGIGRHKGIGVFFRPRAATIAAMEAAGLQVEARACSEGTPFANVLFLGRRR